MQMLTAAEMAATDKWTVEILGIPFTELMDNAGKAVAQFVRTGYPRVRYVLIVCGTGNNGGDGLVAARALSSDGLRVTIALTGPETKFEGASADALQRLDRAAVTVFELPSKETEEVTRSLLYGAELVLDAVTGTGFKPPLRGIAVAVRDALRTSTVPVVAVDLPSGWDADARDQSNPEAFRADAVVTFTAPKPAHLFGHLTAATLGPVVVAQIGSPDMAIQSTENLTWTGTSKALFEQPRNIDSNKGMYGHVLLIGGAAGKSGAPSMSALAALRTGAGLVTAAVARSIQQTVARVTPELMTVPLQEAADGSLALANADPGTLAKLLKKISVLAIGPGLGTEGETPELVRKLVGSTTLPLVLDADGLNAFHGHTGELDGRNRPIVLTPHPGEMATLLGIGTREVQADRLNLARKFAMEHHVTLVLKGWRTLVAHPDGRVAVNTTGNPGMAKGGSGDILTGIVAASIAQFPHNIATAVEAAVYLHGLAADFAAIRRDEHTILATDTIAHLSDAFRYRTEDANGLTWISGLRKPRWQNKLPVVE